MIFGVLNLEKIWHRQIVHWPIWTVYCSHFTLGNPKSHFRQHYSHILQIIYIISEENKLLLPYPPQLKSVTALPCKMHNYFVFFIFLRTSSTNPRYGRVAEASSCDMGWISAERGRWCSWSVTKKTGSMYPCRRWSLWTFVVTLLAWHSICHISQPVFSGSSMPTRNWLFSESLTFGGMEDIFTEFSQMKK